MNLLGKSYDQLTQMSVRLHKSIQNMTAFKEWFDQNPKATKKQITQKYAELVSDKDWRSYAVEHAMKSELGEVIQRITDRTVNEDSELLANVQSEISRRKVEKKQREAKRATAKKMYAILETYLKTHIMTERELGCLELLIDEGNITTADELSEYGVVI